MTQQHKLDTECSHIIH